MEEELKEENANSTVGSTPKIIYDLRCYRCGKAVSGKSSETGERVELKEYRKIRETDPKRFSAICKECDEERAKQLAESIAAAQQGQ